jgi:hypothetical protein
MMNKDYILRIAERFGRTLAIILHLREFNRYEEALITIDEVFLQTVGFMSSFVNSASEEMLLNLLSPLGVLNVEKCLWIAVLLKEEGDIYVELDKEDESYYRYLKSLFFFLEASQYEDDVKDIDIAAAIEDIVSKLEEYELPLAMKSKLFRYFEKVGRYAKAENLLFEMIEGEEESIDDEVVEQGLSFYDRLMQKSDADLQVSGLSRKEIEEGLARLNEMRERY